METTTRQNAISWWNDKTLVERARLAGKHFSILGIVNKLARINSLTGREIENIYKQYT